MLLKLAVCLIEFSASSDPNNMVPSPEIWCTSPSSESRSLSISFYVRSASLTRILNYDCAFDFYGVSSSLLLTDGLYIACGMIHCDLISKFAWLCYLRLFSCRSAAPSAIYALNQEWVVGGDAGTFS